MTSAPELLSRSVLPTGGLSSTALSPGCSRCPDTSRLRPPLPCSLPTPPSGLQIWTCHFKRGRSLATGSQGGILVSSRDKGPAELGSQWFLACRAGSQLFATVCREEAGAGVESSPFTGHAVFLSLVPGSSHPRGTLGRRMRGQCHCGRVTRGSGASFTPEAECVLWASLQASRMEGCPPRMGRGHLPTAPAARCPSSCQPAKGARSQPMAGHQARDFWRRVAVW